MEDKKTIDVKQLRRALLDNVEQSPDGPLWKTASARMAVGVVGALEVFGQPTEDEALSFFDRAGRFDAEGANELALDIHEWASQADEAELASSFEWRKAYEDALSAAPETVALIARDLRAAAVDEIAKQG